MKGKKVFFSWDRVGAMSLVALACAVLSGFGGSFLLELWHTISVVDIRLVQKLLGMTLFVCIEFVFIYGGIYATQLEMKLLSMWCQPMGSRLGYAAGYLLWCGVTVGIGWQAWHGLF